MGWFSKKEEKKEKIPTLSTLPKLPELPSLPDFNEETSLPSEPVHQLPSFPNNSLGDKFSQNTIKEAVTGEKEGDKSSFADDFQLPDKEVEMMPEELEEEEPVVERAPKEFKEATVRAKRTEPVFIRIDKFEESLKLFDKIKGQMSEVEKMLKGIKELKEKEDEELENWGSEIQAMKQKVEKVDKDLFSTIE